MTLVWGPAAQQRVVVANPLHCVVDLRVELAATHMQLSCGLRRDRTELNSILDCDVGSMDAIRAKMSFLGALDKQSVFTRVAGRLSLPYRSMLQE